MTHDHADAVSVLPHVYVGTTDAALGDFDNDLVAVWLWYCRIYS